MIDQCPDHFLIGHAPAFDLALEEVEAAARQAQGHLDLVVARATSWDGGGRKSSTIRTLAVAPLLYLTVLPLISFRSIRQ
jgi:hypothetical protein